MRGDITSWCAACSMAGLPGSAPQGRVGIDGRLPEPRRAISPNAHATPVFVGLHEHGEITAHAPQAESSRLTERNAPFPRSPATLASGWATVALITAGSTNPIAAKPLPQVGS